MTSNPHPPTEGELRGVNIGLVERERYGKTCKFVTFTLEGQSQPFHEIPYFVYSRWEGPFLDMLEAGVRLARCRETGVVQASRNSDAWTGCSDDEVEERKGWQL